MGQKKRLLDIRKNVAMKPHQASLMFNSAKSCFVLARVSLELFMDFRVPGFLLMQQALENLIKSLLVQNKLELPSGSKGHDFIHLLTLGQNRILLFGKIIGRVEFSNLLKQLNEGYTAQKYGEAGHAIYEKEKVMDLFDELVFLLIEEYGKQSGLNEEELERLVAIPVHESFRNIFNRKLKQPFVFLTLSD